GVGNLHLLKGELTHAVEVLEHGLALCRASNLPVALPVLAASLGPAYALTGRASDAIRLLEQAVDQARSMKRAGGHALLLLQLGAARCQLGLGRLRARLGRPAVAAASLASALAGFTSLGMSYWLAEAQAELAAVR